MTDRIAGDWRMLVDEEAIGPDNLIYTLRNGKVRAADGENEGSYSAVADGRFRITIGEMVCDVRAKEDDTINTLTGMVDYGEWSDPVLFSRAGYDIRPPYGGR